MRASVPLLVLSVVLLCSCISAAPSPGRLSREYVVDVSRLSPESQAVIRRVRAQMEATVYPVVTFRSTPLREAIDWVIHQIGSPPDGVGISTVLKFRDEPPPSITFSLRATTLSQILDAICGQAGYTWAVEDYALTIVPVESRMPKPKMTATPNIR